MNIKLNITYLKKPRPLFFCFFMYSMRNAQKEATPSRKIAKYIKSYPVDEPLSRL